MYKDQAMRSKLKNKTVDIETYLTTLGIVITLYLDNINQINELNGFLVGGASQDPKKFIDIVKKTFK